MSDYRLTPAEYRRMKSALTRAENSKDPKKLLSVATAALRRFDEVGYPDDWSRWERAKSDAEFAITRSTRWPSERLNPGSKSDHFNSIRPGDTVTFTYYRGGKGKGRAVMRGPGGWVVNTGGRHGTPAIVDIANFVSVKKAAKKTWLNPRRRYRKNFTRSKGRPGRKIFKSLHSFLPKQYGRKRKKEIIATAKRWTSKSSVKRNSHR